MLIGMLRSQVLRPFYEADGGGSGSGSPVADPAIPPLAAAVPPPATPATQPADPPAPIDPPAPAAGEPTDDEEDAEPELSAEEWQSEATKARKQAARYRTQLRTAEARIAELEAAPAAAPAADPAQAAESRVAAAERRASIAEAAAEIGVPSGMLKAIAQLQAAETPEAIQAALTSLHSFQAPASAGAHRPPVEPSQAPTLDQQIASAEQSGDWKTSMRLKGQKLAVLAAQQKNP
jgi:hypothetical protein